MSPTVIRLAGGGRLAMQRPEPGRFWIRYSLKSWDSPPLPWTDLAAGSLGDASGRSWAPGLAAETPSDEVLYLPPVPSRRAAARDELARQRLRFGGPALIQLLPGETTAVPPVSGLAFVFDLLHCLLERDLGALRALPCEAAAVWPLVPGLTDDPALWEQGCRELAAAGARCVQALTLALTPSDRRRLAEGWGGEKAFDALFHGLAPAERDFARVAARHGLEPFLARPVPELPAMLGSNRWFGGALALAGELWLRLGRPVETGQALYRDARWVDRALYLLKDLAQEGNLGVLPVSPLSREIVTELAEAGESEQLARLLAEYLAPAEAPGDDQEEP